MYTNYPLILTSMVYGLLFGYRGGNLIMPSVSVLLLNDITYGFTVMFYSTYSFTKQCRGPSKSTLPDFLWKYPSYNFYQEMLKQLWRTALPELCSCIASCFWLICRDIFIMLITCPLVVGRDEPH